MPIAQPIIAKRMSRGWRRGVLAEYNLDDIIDWGQ